MHFCRAMLRKHGLCRHAVSIRFSVCLSVCLSVTCMESVKTNKHIFKLFSPSSSHTILVFFPTQNIIAIFRRGLPSRASNGGGIGKIAIAGYRSMTAVVRITTTTVHRAVYLTERHALVNLCLSQLAWMTTTKRRI